MRRNSITPRARRSFAAKNIAFSGRGKMVNRLLLKTCIVCADLVIVPCNENLGLIGERIIKPH